MRRKRSWGRFRSKGERRRKIKKNVREEVEEKEGSGKEV